MHVLLLTLALTSASGADGRIESRQVEGLWSAHCSWGVGVKHTREARRILRVVDDHTLDVLDWVEGTQSSDDPRMDQKGFVILSGPERILVKRKSDTSYTDEDEEFTLKFTRSGRDWEMERAEDICNGMGGEYSFTQEAKAIIPSFSCAKAKQPREQVICGNAALSMLDQQLSLAYRAAERRIQWKYGTASVRTAKLKSLTTSQSKWWSAELGKCQSPQCIEPLYQSRIQYLTALEPDEK